MIKMVNYIKEALSPGGTPQRYLIWVGIILVVQTAASVVPSHMLMSTSLNVAHWLLFTVFALCVGIQFLKKDRSRILAAYCLYIVGLAVSTITISMGITSLSGIIFMLTWAMTLFIAERREYISFDLVTLFMVLMLVSTVILLMYNPSFKPDQNFPVLIAGAVLTGINIYLVYADFGLDKNYYQESRKTYSNLEALSKKMTQILTSQGELKHLLGIVSEECIPLLDLEDCVIYLYDEEKGKLVQVAAYGNKKLDQNTINNPIELLPGQGAVGNCFISGEPVLVKETKYYEAYVADDAARNSELSVPILSNGKVIGVIDSEHSQNGYFKERHLQAFTIIASFCGIKITEYNARESIRQAELATQEAEKYKELDELKNRFIANISHDLKTPLSLIKGPALQISEQTKEKGTQKLAQYILKNAEHLLKVVNQLLQLNRVDKGLKELYLDEIQIDILLHKIVGQYEGLATTKNVELKVNSEKVVLKTDTFRLEQIIHNLLHNAFRYTPANNSIELDAKVTSDHRLQIAVTNSGTAIPPEFHDKIFERFFKVDVNNHEGTGIGLSLVREYAKELGGTIHLDPSFSLGARFIVTLPIAEDKETSLPTELNQLEHPDVSLPVMVIVEDHPDLNNFIYDYFENKFQCYQCFDGEAGFKKIKELEPDIIISDLMMPHTDGRTMIKAIKREENLAHIPIVVLTAKGQTESKIDLYEIGAENYLVKPFDIQELNAILNSILVQRQRLKTKFRENYFMPTEKAILVNEEKPDSFIQQAIRIIHEHLDDNQFSVAQLMQAFHMGRNRLQQEIKEQTGLTPVEFIRSTRLIEARNRLETTDLAVSEVAYSVGFSNLSYFTRSFKAEFGVLPTEVKKAVV